MLICLGHPSPLERDNVKESDPFNFFYTYLSISVPAN